VSDSQPFKSATVYDAIDILHDGMNSGIAPLLLEKTQASYLSNVTVRDGFATCRPPFTKQLDIVYPSPEVQEAVEQGLFQGALPEAYRPDSGSPSQIAQISGRLFQFQVTGDVITVTEITIPGDPNPATATQAWLWQAENFVIVNDGISLPIFWDGVTSRRSYGPTQVLATQDAGPVAKPVVAGQQATLTLTAPYTGPYNVPVLIDGEYYQPIENAGGYLVDAESLYDVPGTPIPVGTEVIARPSIAGVLASPFAGAGSFFATISNTFLTLTAPFEGALFSQIIVFGKIWYVNISSGNTINIVALQAGTYSNLPAGTQIQYSGGSSPNVVYGTESVGVIAPAIGGTVQLTLSNAFTGPAGQIAYIGAVGQYKLTAVPPAPGGTALTVINISNTTAGNFTNAEIISVPELPAGRMGAYGHAQNWVSLVDGISFVCSDISGSPSGTPAYQFRDAVLKTTNITFGSGNFRIPSAGDVITSMSFSANLDVSMGQGPLMVGTERYIFSCVAPVDPANIAAIILKGSPILTYALIGRGPLAQNSTINVNSDIQFRSTVGLGSLVIARQQFTSSLSGNTPISEEMQRVFSRDNPQLLPYSSAINFDNRVLFTASPQASSQGVFHTSLVAMNLDGLSHLRAKDQAAYDGQWTGLNVLQLTRGLFNGVPRAFAFTFNVTLSKIEIYELLPTGDLHFDNGDVPITWSIETASLFREDVKPKNVFLQLNNGEISIDEVRRTVRVQAFYKPDQYGAYGAQSCWIPWHEFTVCAAENSKPLYFPRLGFGEPKVAPCNDAIDAPARFGRTFQVRLVFTGMCRLLYLRVAGVTQPTPQFQPPRCNISA